MFFHEFNPFHSCVCFRHCVFFPTFLLMCFSRKCVCKSHLPRYLNCQKGKLAGKTVSVKYDLEYGQDEFEIQQTALKAGQKVAVVDDVIATGGR